MPTILIVEKSGSIKELAIKTYSEAELYKKAGHKSNEGFVMHTSWSADINNKKYTVQLYGTITGKANQENKFEFPPPVDSVLFFGNCALVNIIDDVVTDITAKEWSQVYEFLYGGFEDIGDKDSETSEDDSEYDDAPRTASGYVKDGFIVDDEASEDDEDDEASDEESSDEDDGYGDGDDDDEYISKSKKAVNLNNTSSTKKDTCVNGRSKSDNPLVSPQQGLLVLSGSLTVNKTTSNKKPTIAKKLVNNFVEIKSVLNTVSNVIVEPVASAVAVAVAVEPTKKPTAKKTTKKSSVKAANDANLAETNSYLTCTNELTFEPYTN